MSDATMITAPEAGVLTAEFVHDGTHVERHQVVATIDGHPIKSEIAGTVRLLDATVGDDLLKGADLWSIAPDGRAYVIAGFKASRLVRIRGGQPVSIRVDGFPKLQLSGMVAPLPDVKRETIATPRGSSHPSSDPRVTIRIDLDRAGPNTDWLTGMPVRVQIDTRSSKG